MTPGTFVLLVLSMGIAIAQPQPTITGGPVNAASYARAGLPNAGIAPGTMFIIFGNNLGPPSIQTVGSFPLPSNLSGTSVRITMAGANFNAIMIYTLATQVAALVPSSVPTGDGTVTVSFGQFTSTPVPIHVVANAFGIFSRNQAGTGPAIAFNFNSQTDQPVNSIIGAAQPKQVVTIWGTGIGAVSGDEASGPLPGDLNLPVDVFIGNKPANILYRGRSGCCAGIDQIIATVPDGVQGCAVSLAVRVAGVVSNFTTIAVAPGRVCSDPAGFSSDDLLPIGLGGNPAVSDISLVHANIDVSVPGLGAIKAPVEQAKASFRRYPTPSLLASTRGTVGGLRAGYPSPGSCVVYPFSFDAQSPTPALGPVVDPVVGDPIGFTSLDVGSALNLKGPVGAKQIVRQGSAQANNYEYQAFIGGGFPGFPAGVQPEYLTPGNYTLDNGSGGADVGATLTSLTIPSSQPVWTNPDVFGNISRSRDQTVTWSGGATGALVVLIGGASADPKLGAGMQFLCSEQADAGLFTIPSWVLSAMPATTQSQKALLGTFAFGSTLAQPARFQATGAARPGGVNLGFFNWETLQVQNANYQ